jgi:VanZ family protein
MWTLSLIALLAASLVPEGTDAADAVAPVWSNLGHIPAYFVFSAVTGLLVSARYRLTEGRLLAIGIAVCGLGLVVEIVQPLFGRTFSLMDIGLNTVGVVVAVAALSRRRWRERMLAWFNVAPFPDRSVTWAPNKE